MKREVVWTWAAETDLQRFYNRAEERREGSGDELLRRIEKAGDLVRRFPRMAPVWRQPVRRLVIEQSSLGLFYVPESRGIVMIGVADLRQEPDKLWEEMQSRIS